MADQKFSDFIGRAHSAASAKAVKKLPDMDINTIIVLLADIVEGKTTPKKAALKFARQGEQVFSVYVKAFAEAAAAETIDDLLKNAAPGGAESLSGTGFAARLVRCSEKIRIDISAYMNGKIEVPDLIRMLGRTDIINLMAEYLKATGIDISEIQRTEKLIRELRSLSAATMSFLALSAAYVILMETLQGAHEAHIRDMEIIAACRESTALICKYRIFWIKTAR